MEVETFRVALGAVGGIVVGVITALGGIKFFRGRWGYSLKFRQMERQHELDDRDYFGQYYRQTIQDMSAEVKLLKASYADVVAKDLQKTIENHKLRVEIDQLRAELAEAKAGSGDADRPHGVNGPDHNKRTAGRGGSEDPCQSDEQPRS